MSTEWTGPQLKSEREKAGIKLLDLARALQMDTGLLSKIENGLRPVGEALPERYLSDVRRIARERAEAVGALGTTHDLNEAA